MDHFTKQIKDNAHLIATDLKCTEEIVFEDRESEYTKQCAKEVFFERVYAIVTGKAVKNE